MVLQWTVKCTHHILLDIRWYIAESIERVQELMDAPTNRPW